MIDVDIKSSGPIFDGRAVRAVAEYCDAAEQAVGDAAADAVRDGTSVFRAPTGHYRQSIHVERVDAGTLVTDGGIVYGPWLEGTSSRNRTTRFEGYRLWELASDRATAEAGPVAERVLPRYLRRMN